LSEDFLFAESIIENVNYCMNKTMNKQEGKLNFLKNLFSLHTNSKGVIIRKCYSPRLSKYHKETYKIIDALEFQKC